MPRKAKNVDTPTKETKSEKAEKVDTPTKVEKVEKVDTPTKVEKVDTPTKLEKVDTPTKVEKVDTPTKVEKVDTPTKVEKVDTPTKVEKVKVKKVDVENVEKEKVDVENVEKEKVTKRNVPTKESVNEEFVELVSNLDLEIVRLRENTGKSKGVKFLRSLGKQIKNLHAHSLRVMKQKKTTRVNKTNSGFLKPVRVSKEMAKFAGWNPEDLKSRVDVTKYICKYIKDEGLQNPEDRRQILVDKKLSKLLDYTADTDTKPLTYYRIQTYIKKHFVTPSNTEK